MISNCAPLTPQKIQNIDPILDILTLTINYNEGAH